MSQPAENCSPIKVENLTYFYPTKLALENISFELAEGSITALVGPNGAGKSTLLRNLAGLTTPYAGDISIYAKSIEANPRAARMKIGYLSDDFGLYDNLKVKDTLEFMGGCHGLSQEEISRRIDEIINLLRLESIIDSKCSDLSRGWRQRVGIAITIIHNPKILILDEPASGLDPEARAELSTTLKTLQRSGMTILVSSHILAELEEYCTGMLVLRDGKIQEHVKLETYQNNQQQYINAELSEQLTEEQRYKLADNYLQYKFVVSEDAKQIKFHSSTDKATRSSLLKGLVECGLPICSFSIEEASLQSLYLKHAK